VIAFPCNQFAGQEPGTDAEILKHVQEEYGVTFDMMSKIDVNGANEIPIYTWMKASLGKKIKI
jgi:glutathione peroxidase